MCGKRIEQVEIFSIEIKTMDVQQQQNVNSVVKLLKLADTCGNLEWVVSNYMRQFSLPIQGNLLISQT